MRSGRFDQRRLCVVFVTATVAVLLTTRVSAHRLDEYLQAARVSIDAERILLDMYLSPGAAVVPAVIGAIDRSGDGLISADEERTYAKAVIDQTSLRVDGLAIPVTLEAYRYPDRATLGAGLGSIHLRAAGTISNPTPGTHYLIFENGFRAPGSVYLANAMLPRDLEVRILSQDRDQTQARLGIQYRVDLPAQRHIVSKTRAWTVAGIAALALAGMVYRRAAALRGAGSPRSGSEREERRSAP